MDAIHYFFPDIEIKEEEELWQRRHSEGVLYLDSFHAQQKYVNFVDVSSLEYHGRVNIVGEVSEGTG